LDISLKLNVRETSWSTADEKPNAIQEIIHQLVKDEERNQTITNDVVAALDCGRQCLILTQRKEHCRSLA